MALPINLILVRHGQSEGNKAKRSSEAGDDGLYTPEFMARHSSSFRLTERGREQADQAGKWLRKNFRRFDRHYVSEYLRAIETAALLRLPNAEWFTDFYLTERDWGELDVLPQDERELRFGDALRRREAEPFFWRPPNGETFAQLCLRVDRVLHTLHRECSDRDVIIACHGEVIQAFQIRIERMSQARFRELTFSERSDDRIHNCQIVHYSRRCEGTGRLSRYAEWVRMVRPTDNPLWDTGWRHIERPRYSSDDLLRIVERTPAMIN
jgi:NAD+ kinase